MKRILKISVIAIMLAMVSTMFLGCNPKKDDPSETTTTATTYVAMDINPTVEFILDEQQKVVSIKAVNSDAQVMLYNETEIIGLNIEQACLKLSKLAKEYGYISSSNRVVSVSVISDDAQIDSEVYSKIQSAVTSTFVDSTFQVEVSNTISYTLEKELNQLKLANEGKAGYNELTINKYRLIKSAMIANVSLTMDVAVKMEIKQLAKMVENAHEAIEDMLGDNYGIAKNKAKFVKNSIVESFKDSAYSVVYGERLLNNPSLENLENKGAKYVLYRTAHRNLEHYIDILEDEKDNSLINDEMVNEIISILQIEEEKIQDFKTSITDINGNITEDSIEDYINKTYRNLSKTEKKAMEEKFDLVDDLLDEADESAEIITEKEIAEINALIAGININISIETIDDVEDVLDFIEDRYDAIKDQMKEELTDAEKARVKELQDKTTEAIQQAEAEYRNTIAKLKAEAAKQIAELKASRKAIAVEIIVD